MPTLAEVEQWLDRLYVAAPGATLRGEAHKKARELVGLLAEIARAIDGSARSRRLVLVDAAAGKSPVGLLAAALLLAPRDREAVVVLIELEPARAEAARTAASLLADALGGQAAKLLLEIRCADVADPAAWPVTPDVVVALHACGAASDHVIARATAIGARRVLVAPCCVADDLPAARRARAQADVLGIDGHAEVRRRLVQAHVDTERVLALEAAGYETVAVPFCPPTVTPHNLLYRARRVGEPVRAARAAAALRRLQTQT